MYYMWYAVKPLLSGPLISGQPLFGSLLVLEKIVSYMYTVIKILYSTVTTVVVSFLIAILRVIIFWLNGQEDLKLVIFS